jgi:uncharacterized membrane protein
MLTAYRQYLLTLIVLFLVTAIIVTLALLSFAAHINPLHILSMVPNIGGWNP